MDSSRLLPQLLFSLYLLLISGCSVPIVQPPNVIIDSPHNGSNMIAISPDSKLVASGGWEGTINLWHLPDGKPVYGWQAHSRSIEGMVFTRNGRMILSASFDGSLAEWDLQGNLQRRVNTDSPVTHMQLDEQNNILITGHRDGYVRIWRYPEIQLSKQYHLHQDAVKAVAWHRNNRLLASSGEDGQVYVWVLDQAPHALQPPPSDAWVLEFSPDGQTLMGGGWFSLYRWQLSSNELEVLETEHGGIIRDVEFSKDGNILATISRQTDSAVLFLDPRNGKLLKRLQPHALCGTQVHFSPDQNYLVTTSDDASIRIWDFSNPLPLTNHY